MNLADFCLKLYLWPMLANIAKYKGICYNYNATPFPYITLPYGATFPPTAPTGPTLPTFPTLQSTFDVRFPTPPTLPTQPSGAALPSFPTLPPTTG